MKKTKWFTLTGPLHVFQFDVNVALDVQRQGCLAPRDQGSVDDTHVAASHSLPGLPQKIQCDCICSYFIHLRKKKIFFYVSYVYSLWISFILTQLNMHFGRVFLFILFMRLSFYDLRPNQFIRGISQQNIEYYKQI